MRAQALRRQAGVLLPERADPYAEEMKRIAEEQKARAAAEKEAAKAAEEQAREAEKARQAAEKAALAEENNAKEKQYRREKRPMYVDADGRIQSQVTDEEWQKQRAQKAKNDELRTKYFQQNRPWIEDAQGNIIPRQTDEEWQAAQNEKAAKLEAAKVDKANETLRKERKQEITGVQRGMTDAREAINLRTSELELQHSEATAQAKRRADFIKQTQDQIENGLDLAPDRVARMEQAMAAAQKELDQWQAKADALDAEVRSQKAGELAFRKAQQPVASAMQAAEDAIPSLTVADAPMGISSPPKPGGVAPKADAASVPAVREGVLSHQQAAIASDPTLPAAKRKAALEDIAARRDPVAYAASKRKRMRDADAPTLKAALDEEGPALQARLQDYQQRMAALQNESAGAQQAVQSLLQRNQQRLQQPHKGADLVTVDGPDGQPMSVFADLADEYQDSLAQWQEKREKLQAEADVLDTEAEEIKLDQQLYNEGVQALNAKAEAEHTARRKAAQQEQDAKLRRMELTGQAGPASKIRQMQADLAAERAVIDEMFPEDSPEKRQQIDKLRQKAEQQQAEITREVHGLQRFGAMLYDRFKDVSTNFIDRSTTDPEGIEASDTTNKIIDDAAKAKGLNPEDVRRVMETQRVLDWRKPLSGTAARMQENVLSGLWEKEFGPIEAARLLPDGGVIPNPVLGADKAAFDKAIQESGASKKAQAEAQKLWPEYQRRFGEAAADALMQEPDTPGSFQDYRAEMIQRDQDSGGKLGFARLSPGEQAIRYLENRGTRRGDEKWAQLIGRNLYAGFGDFATQVLGVGAAVTGNEDLSNLAVENQRNMESLLTGQQYGGPKGLAAGIVGQSARMLPGVAATVSTGSLGGAIAMGGVQTGGANYAETYQALREAGVSHEDAWQRSAISAYVSGAMTAALTKAFPGGATAMLKPGAAAAGKRAMTNAVMTAVKAVGKGFADEVPQEVLDEGFSQLTAATAAGKPLNEAVRDFVTGLPELIGAAGLMGGAGGAIEGGRTESVPPPAPQTPPQAEAGNIAPEAPNISAPASNISPAPRESELSKPDMGSEGAGDRFMAARGAVAAWDGGSMPEAKKAVTKAKAEVLIKIAEGAKPADLEQEELMAVGLRREDDGRITVGHMDKGKWKKGPRDDGMTSVELLDGQFIITDHQIKRLRKVGLDAVADAIAKTAAERRKEIMGEPAEAVKTTEWEPSDEELAQAETVLREKGNVSTSVLQRRLRLGYTRAVATIEALVKRGIITKDANGNAMLTAKIAGKPAPAVVPASAEAVATNADEIPMEWEAKADVETLRQGEEEQSAPLNLVSPDVKQRASEIATVLEKSGVPREVVLDVAAKAVEASGIDPDGYASQMMSPAFDAAMKSQGWVRKPSNPMQWEPADLNRARTGPEMAQQKASMRPAEVVKAEAKPRQELSAREDWRKAREGALRTQFAKLEKLKDRAKAKEEFTKITRADKVLVDLVDNRYGALFDEVRIGTNPAGLSAMPLTFDEKGRATTVALLIDPASFYAHGGLTPLEIEKALDEELKHRVDLMVSSRREAIDLAQAIHKARPGVFDRVWQDYFAIDIREGNLPAKVPAVLTDDQAYQLYFEATRMIHQGTLTTETIQDVGTLRQIWRYLRSWLKHVRREMRKLPKELLGEWNARIEAAENLLQKLEARAVALEKAALDDVEPPEQAVRGQRSDVRRETSPRGADPDLDAEIQAAWESEQKARRHVPTFTPTQQALRNLRALKDPDNDQINILSRIAMEGGIEIYSDKARKLRKQQGKPVGGELDWLEKANLTPFWKGIVFRRGNVQTIDQTLQLLHEEGYFPEAATEADVTGEMLAAKLEDVLARYQALKEGQGDLADADEQHGNEMAKLERQRVEFERATADGPLKVRPADLKPGDVMQVKGDDGKLHPVEVLRLETRPLESGEDYDPQGNPGHRMGPDGPEVIESVTLKDGTTFGVQMVDGQEGLYVDEFKVKDAYDFHASLREAVLTRKLTDDEALLHFMDHEGIGPDAPYADILRQLQSKLRIPMKRAQELLAAVFDTAPRGDGRAEIDTDNPLGAARKRDAGPSMFGEDFDLLSGDSQNRGLFEQAMGTPAAVEASTAGFALEAVTPEQLDAEMAKAARKAKLQARQEAPLVGTAGEYGTPDLLDVTAGPMALFSQPVAARGTLFTAPKRVLMRAEQDAASEPPPARPDLDDYLPPKAERKTSGKVATGVKQWHAAFRQWKQQFAQWAERQGKLGAFLAPPVKSAFGPMYQRANVVTPKAGGGWRTTVFGRYEPDGITEMSGDWADGAWVPIGHHEFESQAEAYEDAMSGMDGAEFTRRALFAAAKRVQGTGTLFGEDQMMFLGDRGTKGLFEAPGGMARLGDKETRGQGDAPAAAKTTNPAKAWALSLPSSETGELPPLKDATKPLGLAANATPFKPGQITADHWGDDPFVYRDQWVDPRTLKDAFNLEGLTYEQVVNMPSTQQYMQWFREGNVPPPITLVFNEPEKRLRSISRRRVVAALETGQTRIPARVDIGKASTVMGKVSIDTPAAEPMEPITQAPPNVVDRPNHLIPRYWQDEQGRVRKAKKLFRVVPGRGTSELRWLQRPTDTVVFTGTEPEARQWVQDQGGVFVERETPAVSPAPASPPSDFTLESTTPAQLDAEARRKELREKLRARQDAPLIGTQGDIGQMDMLGGGDLFAQPPAAKPAKSAESGEPRAEGQSLANARKRGATPPASPFYSKLAQVIEQKMPARADAKTIWGLITNPQTGIKQEELKWSGILPWLEDQARRAEGEGQRVSKQAVLDYLASDGAVRLEEVRMGAGTTRSNPEAEEAVRQASEDVMRLNAAFAEETGESIRDYIDTNGSGDVANLSDKARSILDERARAWTRYTTTKTRLELEQRPVDRAKFAQYQLPGGENYREVVLAMPIKRQVPTGWYWKHIPENERNALKREWGLFNERGVVAWGDSKDQVLEKAWNYIEKHLQDADGRDSTGGTVYTSSHFPDVPNYVAHARLNDRVDAEGRLGTFIEEIQSDRHQAGREKGYKGDFPQALFDEVVGNGADPVIARAQIEQLMKAPLSRDGGDATTFAWDFLNRFATSDLNQVFHDAPETAIPDAPFRTTWPLQMFKRALAEAVAQGKQWIGWTTGDTQAERYDLSKQVDHLIYHADESLEVYGKDGDKLFARQVPVSALADHIGKEAAEKLMALEPNADGERHLTNADLKVGGEGMKGFYDTILPKEIGKYVRQWGSGVVKGEVTASKPLRADAQGLWMVEGTDERFTSRAKALAAQPKTTPIWRVDITPAMRAGVEAGQALFASRKRGEPRAESGETEAGRSARAPVDEAAHEAATSPLNDLPEPTEAQKEAGNYKLGHVRIAGHEISIENPAGSKRRPEWPALKDHYGYFKGTNAKDGDHVDVFVKPGTPEDYAGPVHVVRQNKVENGQKTGQFDEYKVMLGYPTAEEAREAYLRNYEPGWPGLHKLTTHSQAEFQKIKDTLFTVPADRVPGVREADAALASGVKRASSPITPEQDAEYLAAVQAGDMDKAQRMVDEAAKAAGYNYGPLFHSRLSPFTAFKKHGQFMGVSGVSGIHLTDNEDMARRYLDRYAEYGWVDGKPNQPFRKEVIRVYAKIENPLHRQEKFQSGIGLGAPVPPNYVSPVERQGYDALIRDESINQKGAVKHAQFKNAIRGKEIILFKPEHVKLADPVTRDAAGNVIPLSQRFNPESDSILYAAPKRRANPAASPGVIPPAATAEDFARPDNALLRGMSNADWNRLDKAVKKRLDRILEPVVRQTVKAGDAAVEKLLDWVVGESLEGLEHAAGTTIEDVQQRKAAREALKAQARRAWQKTVRQVMPDATVPADVLAKMREMRAAESLSQEKALDVSKRALEGKTKLLDIMAGTKAEEFKSPDVRRKMYLAMNAKINSGVTMDDLTPEQKAVALALKQAWWENGMRRVRNGTLKLETFQDMAEGLPQYYEDDVNLEKGFIPRAFKMGLKGLIAQRSTRFHIVDKTSKDKSGEFALVNWTDPSTKRTDWKYKSKAHMDAAYEQIIEDQILAAKDARTADYGKLAPDDIRTLRQYTWMTDADRAALAGVTREKLRQPASLTTEQKAVVDRMTEQLHSRFQKKVPLTYQQHEKAGLIQDPFYAIGRALLESGHDNATAEFFNYIAKQPDYVRDVAENGFTAMPDDPKMGRLAGKWVRDDVAAELEQMLDVPNMVMRFYDALLAGFKYGHTILNLGSHVRNILGNVSFATLAGSNPLNPGNAKAYAEANRLLRDGGPTFEALHKLGILGGDYLTNEVRRALRQLLPDPDTVERMIAAQDMSWLTGLKEQMARKFDKATGVLAAIPRGMENAWKWEDDIYKVAAFIKARQQGMSEEEAAAHVRKWFPFYDKGSSGTLKALGRFVFPFLSFKRESLRIMGHALRERPLAFLTMMAIPRLLTQLSFTILELQLIAGMAGLGDDDEEDLLKDMKGKAGGLLAPFTDASLFSIALPWRDANGGMAQWDLSAVIPWSDWLSTRIEYGAEKPWFQRVASQIVSGAPFASLLVETWANQDTFSGRRIWEDDMSGTEKAGRLAEHVYMKLAPPMIGPHVAAMKRAMEQQPSKLLPSRNPTQALMRILGIDIKPLAPDLYRKAEEYRKAKGAPVSPRGGQAFPQDAASRARARLYMELIQPEIDVQAADEAFAALEALGEPVRTLKDLSDLFKDRSPETIMPAKMRPGFVQSLPPESRRVYDSARTQQGEAFTRSKSVLQQRAEMRRRAAGMTN